MALQPFLDPLVLHYERPELLRWDPLGLVYELALPDKRSQEIVAFLASGLAYGRIAHIEKSVRDVLARMEGDPVGFIESYAPRPGNKALHGWVHRLNVSQDIVAVVKGMQRIYKEFGDLEGFFLEGYDRENHQDIGPALESFSSRFLALSEVDTSPARPGLPGVSWLFSRPEKGSACKRLNLFLRWMVRPDFPDLGLWPRVSPAHLVMPVDTHVARICGYLGLTRRKAADWKMATEITSNLRALSPTDPIRYDWAISRLGILDDCSSRVDPIVCRDCSLVPVCRAGA